MPEGDTIHRAAQTLRRALAGHVVTRFDSVYPRLTRVHDDAPVTGRTIEDVQAIGKHLVFSFSGDLVMRSHLRMHGRWHIYRTDEPWRAPSSAVRVVIGTREYTALGLDLQDVTFHTRRTLERDSPIGRLGPDLLAEHVDEGEAVRRLREPPDEAIGHALLQQWRLAGIGNVYKSEVLFLCGRSPFAAVGALTDDELTAIVQMARKLMLANVTSASPSQIVTFRALRRTTSRLAPEERHWVYRRTGLPCRRCGTRIQMRKTGDAARSTYFCPRCQPADS